MRISDWSSDVCSSDLRAAEAGAAPVASGAEPPAAVTSGHERAETVTSGPERAAAVASGPERSAAVTAGVEEDAAPDDRPDDSTEERRVGKEGVRTSRDRGVRYT